MSVLCPAISDSLYSPTTRTSLWISSLRHLLASGDTWKDMERTGSTATLRHPSTNSASLVMPSTAGTQGLLCDVAIAEVVRFISNNYSSMAL